MSDVIQRLRAANPEPDCPPPPIEGVWRRLDADGGVARRVRRISAPVATPATSQPSQLGHRGGPASDSLRLAALRAQSGQLLGRAPAFHARVRQLRGLPIVINVWASWCELCRKQARLVADAADRYNRRVAFLGADIADTKAAGRSFLAHHPSGYPSYQSASTQLRWLVPRGLVGIPTTIFIDTAGKVVSIHFGAYQSAAALNRGIERAAKRHGSGAAGSGG